MLARTAPDGGPILPPHNLPLEQAVLGAILFENELLEVCAGLEPDHFFEPFHRQLFGLISGMIRHGRKANPLTLKAALSETVVAPSGMTAAQYVSRCASEAADVRPQEVKQYAHEVVVLSWNRGLKERLEDVQGLLDQGDAVELLSALRESTTAIEVACPVVRKDEVTSWWRDPATIAPRPFLYNRHYQRRTVSATIGAGGRAKTTYSLYEAVMMAKAGLHVGVLNGEEEQDELDRRVAAICRRHDITESDLDGRLWVKAIDENSLRVAIQDAKGRVTVNACDVEWISRFIGRRKLDVLIIDPLVSFHGVNENDNAAMDFVAKDVFRRMARKHDCAIDLLHHPSKPKPGAIDTTVEDGRGASSLLYAVRSSRVVNFMTSKEADDYGIKEDERRMYIRFTNGKTNSGPTGTIEWFHLWVEILPNGDHVAVCERWLAPKPFDDVTTAHSVQCRQVAQGGAFRADTQAKNWFGYEVAKVIGVDDVGPKTPGRAKVIKIIRKWLETGLLQEIDGTDEQRKPRKFIAPGIYKDEQPEDRENDDS